MHLDEAENALAVLVWHPVGRLDLATRQNVLLEMSEALIVGQVCLVEGEAGAILRSEDRVEGERVGHRLSSEIERRARST
jgi:hypothetical protein